jgi:hypothetical protein
MLAVGCAAARTRQSTAQGSAGAAAPAGGATNDTVTTSVDGGRGANDRAAPGPAHTAATGTGGHDAGAKDAGKRGAADAGDAAGVLDIGTLPAVADLEDLGPFTQALMDNTGPDASYRLFYPRELGKNGIKHPIVLFGQGGGFTENYATLIEHVTTHGFVVLCYWNTPQANELLDGLSWLIQQNDAPDGMLSGKLDTAHVAGMGHSYGSLGIFNIAGDPRITTTVHLQGGTLDPHAEVANLRAPAAFICGESPSGDDDGVWTGDMSNPNCAADFEKATVPVFYGSLEGAAHIELTDAVEDADDPLRLKMIGAVIGWLRWQLAGDESRKRMFVGSDCELCEPGSGWTIEQKNLM